ncbi:type I-G CRISPR-associated helicase/endonuclease Cas3g [Chloracidobacterium thermophilum]|uniref:CRISPR-associated helicase Cas3, Anaes-subtype n=1 Tax=Chloracidobacterium thermophilum (strain B) TaxID=981222 RepID=G2LLL4_CHLTF|nr:type I-U CRISPR-associated helicase/endonuclease Cas3 [Chloracidobacterium thermophilum]AEP13810.1 CRISPR-associated helicase Cas3, Anaes-subtype [Chloracidobacterium thermophilum B]
MTQVGIGDFDAFFREAHDCDPYPWQRRLAAAAVAGDWPPVLDLPTGSGKTAVIDIAVFALACQAALEPPARTAARRVFFCVNRRVIVDATYERALRLAGRLLEAEASPTRWPTLHKVAAALRQLSTLRPESAPPLDVLELRGGLYRDNRWARSVTQPMVVCTTIDQFGSRLLFRGYGVSAHAAPIHASLAAYDSLVFLDEAHISEPFRQTLCAVQDYLDPQRWAEEAIGVSPFRPVAMTATPPKAAGQAAFRLDHTDRRTPRLAAVLGADKLVQLRVVSDLPKDLVFEAKAMAETGQLAVGIIVNRVATARAVHRLLCEAFPDAPVELVIGPMRPVDRDAQQRRLMPRIGPDRPDRSAQLSFVVATQCLEVGADYDFDVLLTECASLDALRQRFGRLNRRGRPIAASAVVFIEVKALNPKKPDPVYGDALPKTWEWLTEWGQSDDVNFGIDAFDAYLNGQGLPVECLAPAARREPAVLLPAHLDLLCQTSPRPALEPNVGQLLHGPQPGEPDVQVCWRADLDAFPPDDWSEVVSLLPPTATECMTVPMSVVRRWLTGAEETGKDDAADLLELGGETAGTDAKPEAPDGSAVKPERRGLLWRGLADNRLLTAVSDLRPGDTLVFPVAAGGWEVVGHLPVDASPDAAEAASVTARNRPVVRLHPHLFDREWPALQELFARLAEPETVFGVEDWREALRALADDLQTGAEDKLPQHWPADALRTALHQLADPKLGLLRTPYPDGRGYVLTTRKRLAGRADWSLPLMDEGEDERSWIASAEPVTLAAHSRHVRDEIQRTVRALPLNIREEVFLAAAEAHDWGKADERFQALLQRADRTETWLLGASPLGLLAKSDGLPLTPLERRQAHERAGLPAGFRHEMLSVQMMETLLGSVGVPPAKPGNAGILPAEPGNVGVPPAERESTGLLPAELDLILYLIGTHHGRGRPLAPVVVDLEAPDVALTAELLGQSYTVAVSHAWREKAPPHRLDSGIGARFWRMQRRFGWWGAAYLETILRLADHQASADEEAGLVS